MSDQHFKKVLITAGQNDAGSRKGIIGSSQIGAVAGFEDGYVTQYDVYLAYNGIEKEIDEETRLTFAYGHAIEEAAARMFTIKTGIKVIETPYEYVHGEYDFLVCHMDRIMPELVNGKKAALECKGARYFAAKNDNWGEEFTDQVPEQYLCQCHWYMALSDVEVVYLVRVTDNRPYVYVVEKDEELERQLIETAVAFRNRLDTGWIPDAQTSKEATIKFRTSIPRSEVRANAEILEKARDLATIKAEYKKLEKQIDKLEATVKDFMGENERLIGPNGKPIITWITSYQNKFSQKDFELADPETYNKFKKETPVRYFKIAAS